MMRRYAEIGILSHEAKFILALIDAHEEAITTVRAQGKDTLSQQERAAADEAIAKLRRRFVREFEINEETVGVS